MRALLAFVLAMLLAAGCEREARRLEASAPPVPTAKSPPEVQLQPGQSGLGMPVTSGGVYSDRNALAISNGKRLYKWYNCNGCHASGGGGMGPALMDEKWIYGSEPENIHRSILDGRPNGMPSFRGRIPDEQAWQLVAYVRSLAGLVPKDATAPRGDGIQAITK